MCSAGRPLNSPMMDKTVSNVHLQLDFSTLTGKGIRAAIVDSGIDAQHPDLLGSVRGGVCITLDAVGEICFAQDYHDVVGHGTACAGIVRKKAPGVELYAVKVLDEQLTSHGTVLVEAIRWASDQGIQVLNLSLGTTAHKHISMLEKACKYAREKGVFLIAAAHSTGLKSYPAALPQVLSVGAAKIRDKYGYYYCSGNSPQFLARGDKQRVLWADGGYSFIDGTSFAAPHLAAIVALILEKHPRLGFEEMMDILIANAAQTVQPAWPKPRPPLRSVNELSWIKRAVLYPFNKEMHSLIRFRDLLPFQIEAVVDARGRGLLGKDAGEILGLPTAGLVIQADLESALESADTLIVGHLEELGRLKRKNLLTDALKIAARLGKHVYSFSKIPPAMLSDLCGYQNELDVRVEHADISGAFAEKLANLVQHGRRVSVPMEIWQHIPIVGVFGTSSQQGKFTTQLTLRRELLQRGYRVGQLGTEPQSPLFGIDVNVPLGYQADLDLLANHPLPTLRYAIKHLAELGSEIILVGGQSGFIPYDIHQDEGMRLSFGTLMGLSLLLGTLPQAYILQVNSIDPLKYIEDTIRVMEGLGKGKTILLAMSDKEKVVRATAYRPGEVGLRQMSQKEIRQHLNRLENHLGIPATEVVSLEGQEKLVSTVIDHFSRHPVGSAL